LDEIPRILKSWTPETAKSGDHEYHMKSPEAKRLMAKVLEAFRDKHGIMPAELFSEEERL
jgi:hypothetical protein